MEGKKGIRKLYINLISDDDDAKLMLKEERREGGKMLHW